MREGCGGRRKGRPARQDSGEAKEGPLCLGELSDEQMLALWEWFAFPIGE